MASCDLRAVLYALDQEYRDSCNDKPSSLRFEAVIIIHNTVTSSRDLSHGENMKYTENLKWDAEFVSIMEFPSSRRPRGDILVAGNS